MYKIRPLLTFYAENVKIGYFCLSINWIFASQQTHWIFIQKYFRQLRIFPAYFYLGGGLDQSHNFFVEGLSIFQMSQPHFEESNW